MNIKGIIFVVLVTLGAILIGVSAKIIVKRESEDQLDNQSAYLPSMEKRPFCNAFTGCGKKRSSSFESLDSRQMSNPLIRLNKQILKEAKLWELMQNRFNNNEMPPLTLSGVEYITARKRRSIQSEAMERK